MRQRTGERELRGRRVADRPVGGGRSATAVAVVLPIAFGVLAWVGAGAGAAPGDASTPAVDLAAVDRVDLLCPPTPGAGGTVRVARPDVGAEQAQESVLRAGSPGDLDVSFDVPLGASVGPDRGTGQLALRAEGGGAPGVFADALVTSATSGLAAASCPAPGTSWWFSGGGADADHRSALTLTNLDQGPAVVDIRLHGVDGPLPAESLRGVTLAPGDTRTWAWADVVPGQAHLTVEVRVVRGRVAATSREEGAGAEWPAAGAPPGARQQVPAVPAGPGRSVLTVTNPGQTPTRATVRVVTDTGAFVPLELGEVFVEPGAVASLDLTEALGADAAAVEVTADAEVVAGLRKTVRSARDVATVPATPPLTGTGAVGAGPGRTVLHLSAGEDGAVAEVAAVGADGGTVAEERFSIRSSSLVTWVVPPEAAYVVVEPIRGAPYAAAARSGQDSGVAVVPVAPLPLDRIVPQVLPQSES